MKVAVIGATGMVGQVMLKVLEERSFPLDELIVVASSRSVGLWASLGADAVSTREALQLYFVCTQYS